jgi:6-pyruvoyltetrahydropterin/6-carboxytetrahydropterin synthase
MGFYIATKAYEPKDGLCCCVRQWKSSDRDGLLHGKSIYFKMVFECRQLSENDTVMDFATLMPIQEWLNTQFDRTTVIAADDPQLPTFTALHKQGLVDLVILPGVSCERFAEHAFKYIMQWLIDNDLITRATIRSVECFEHEGNSALYVE